jgi:hypothetical protein
VSQRFWTAFGRLCDLIKPVNTECLAARLRVYPVPWWNLWMQGQRTSLVDLTSRKYIILLFFLLVIITPIQLYGWMTSSLSNELAEARKSLLARTQQLSQDYGLLLARTGGDADHKWTADESAGAEKIINAQSIEFDAGQLWQKANQLQAISDLTFAAKPIAAAPSNSQDLQWYDRARNALASAQFAISQTLLAGGQSALVNGVMVSFILPILFGALGAVAFSIRNIFEQRERTTFSETSAARHMMRIALGCVTGAVVGFFNGLTTQLNLQPLALAFLAGYGVEAVFLMFDGLIEKFRQPTNGSAASPRPAQ